MIIVAAISRSSEGIEQNGIRSVCRDSVHDTERTWLS